MMSDKELDPRLLQGDRSHKEWLVALGFTRWRDRFSLLIVDAYQDVQEVPMVVDSTGMMIPSQVIIRQRQEEIQAWADAIAAAEADEAAMYGLDLSTYEDRAMWDATRPDGSSVEITDYSRDAFEFGQIVPLVNTSLDV